MDELYSFVFRGLLADDALDRAGRRNAQLQEFDALEVKRILSFDLLDGNHIDRATIMADVYIAVAAFENSVRDLITSVLIDHFGVDWWTGAVSEKIRTRATQKIEEEQRVRWHVQRGGTPINYTLMSDLTNIIQQNWVQFEPYLPSIEWARNIFDGIERSRNVIMHSGFLDKTDVERVGMYIRDWIKQVGA